MHRLIFRAACLVALGALASCSPRSEDENGTVNATEPAAQDPPSLVPVPEPALDRSGLLSAVASAASAAAAGTNDSGAQRTLDGRQFEVRIRFGCNGPSEKLAEDWLGWAVSPDGKTLRVRAAPTVAADDPIVRKIVGDTPFEAIEGFWVPRPWLLDATCPAGQAPIQTVLPAAPAQQGTPNEPAPEKVTAAETLPEPPRIGLVQFYLESDSRTGRRDRRAYEAVEPLDGQMRVGAQGFNLVLSGRLKAVPGRKVILCAAANPDSPPECLISADFDRVWIETPDGKVVIAEWTHG